MTLVYRKHFRYLAKEIGLSQEFHLRAMRHRGEAELQACLPVRFRYLSANGMQQNCMFRFVSFSCRVLKGRTS